MTSSQQPPSQTPSERLVSLDLGRVDPPASAQHKAEPPISFTFYDVFFWRDAPDWYRKTFTSAGFGLCYCILKQYLNRHELEVFMPPRSKILPQTMQEGYRNSQMLKYGFLKVGSEITTIAGAAAIYYAGAWYMGRYREGIHSWENFAFSGSAAGLGVALWMLRPVKARPLVFGMLLGGVLGGAGAYTQQALGVPFWDETHDFEGWFLGSRVNLKDKVSEGGQLPPSSSAAAASSSSSPPEAAPATLAVHVSEQPAVQGHSSTGARAQGRSWWSPWGPAPVPPEKSGGH